MLGLLARKVGMTQFFTDTGNVVPVTVIHIEPNVVIAKKEKKRKCLLFGAPWCR